MGGAAAPGSAAAFRMITAAPCRELSLVCSVDFGLPGGATARPLETVHALWVLCRLADGAYLLRGKSLFLLWESGMCLPYSWFLPARQGPKPLFLLLAKEKAVLDSEKEKVDQWKSWGGAVQQDRLPVLRCCSSGEILWDIVLLVGGPGLSDSWSPLRHCR